jgi:hypothetical protein
MVTLPDRFSCSIHIGFLMATIPLLRLRASRGLPLQQYFEFSFDFQDSLLPVPMLDHFIFPVVFVLEVLAVLGTYLQQFGAKARHPLRY